MAHNLTYDVESGKSSMMYVGEAPWHALGTKLDKPATAKEAMAAAQLNWKVEKTPLFIQTGEGGYTKIENKFVILKAKIGTKKDSTAFGVVGRDYTPLQNTEAFEFLDPIVGKGAAIYHTAGALGDGERIWVLAKLPSDIRVVGDDITNKFLLLSNSHDGMSSVQIKFTPIRVVCENTLTMALSRGPTIRVAHTKDVKERLHHADRMLGIINKRFDGIQDVFQRMVKISMDRQKRNEYISEVFPEPTPSADEEKFLKARRRVLDFRNLGLHLFENAKGNDMTKVKGTLWAAYNGITELVDHWKPLKSSPTSLESVWFGPGYLTKARAFKIAEEKTGVWLN